MMNLKIFFFISFFLLFSCTNKHENKNVRIKTSNNEFSEGKLVADSLFNGKVKYYDSSNNYLGYSTFRYGKKEGTEVGYFKNGKVSDSSFYHNDMQNGFAYKFDENGYLHYKSYYLNDRPFGHLFEYDSSGNVTHYYFINFENKIIFEFFKVNNEEYRKGDEIQMNTFSENGSKNNFLFLYLFSSPFTPRHYEIGILDSSKKIIFSKPIISTDCFYEQEIPDLPNGKKYAIILHTYNSFKKRDDLAIKIIE